MNDSTLLRTEPADGVALLTINRPERLNALDDEMLLEGFPGLLDELAADERVRVVVLTGAGRAFSAGADLGSAGFRQPDQAATRAYMERAHRTPRQLATLPQPTLAAVNGPAVGAGLGLALACDLRFAGRNARFGDPHVGMGLVPAFGVTRALPALVGQQAAMDLVLSGRLVGADEARLLGLTARTCDDVVADALEWAAAVAAQPPGAVRRAKRNLRRAPAEGSDEMIDVEISSQLESFFSGEFRLPSSGSAT